jgi:phenylpropionate dioxygenase-like ring-hydroxylating dioxygenase large terminal subunit
MEVPLVLGRDAAGKAFALRDVCPHRAFPLSAGSCDGQTVECTYHGWRFDAHTGQCREIPSITADSKLQCDRIYAGSFPCEERDGYVWVYLANPEGRAARDRRTVCARAVKERRSLARRSCRNSASATASRISLRTSTAAWTRASSA